MEPPGPTGPADGILLLPGDIVDSENNKMTICQQSG